MNKKELDNYSLYITVENYNVRGKPDKPYKKTIHELPVKKGESLYTDCGFIKIEKIVEDEETKEILGLVVKNDGDEQKYKTLVPIGQNVRMEQTYGTKPDVYHLRKCKLLLTKNNNYYKGIGKNIDVKKLILK